MFLRLWEEKGNMKSKQMTDKALWREKKCYTFLVSLGIRWILVLLLKYILGRQNSIKVARREWGLFHISSISSCQCQLTQMGCNINTSNRIKIKQKLWQKTNEALMLTLMNHWNFLFYLRTNGRTLPLQANNEWEKTKRENLLSQSFIKTVSCHLVYTDSPDYSSQKYAHRPPIQHLSERKVGKKQNVLWVQCFGIK